MPDLKATISQLRVYIEAEGFKGYDPYDTLNSVLPFRLFGTYAAAVATQVQKRNPLNIRPLIGIRKDYNPKGLGLLLYGYVVLQQTEPNADYSAQMKKLFGLIRDCATTGYSGVCWGYNFGWASPGKYLPPYTPTGVVTSFVMKGLLAYYRLAPSEDTLRLLESASQFLRNDLPVTTDATGRCISYSPVKRDVCYNASLLAAEALAGLYSVNRNEDLRKEAVEAATFVLARQQEDGRWNYSFDEKEGKERAQIDFHQGYVIDSLSAIRKYTGAEIPGIGEAVRKGLAFYREKQFVPDGRGVYRYPEMYPVDIHNQAQGILTMVRHADPANVNDPNMAFAKVIARWTIENMFDEKKGYFYYRKYRTFTHKIPYMRWSNAWMLVALTELFSVGGSQSAVGSL